MDDERNTFSNGTRTQVADDITEIAASCWTAQFF